VRANQAIKNQIGHEHLPLCLLKTIADRALHCSSVARTQADGPRMTMGIASGLQTGG
jgi:hypothetical protein